MKIEPPAQLRDLAQAFVERTPGRIGQITRDHERRAAHALHAMDQYAPPRRNELVQVPHGLLQPEHVIALAIDELHAAPIDAVRIVGAVGPTRQRQDAGNSGIAQPIQVHGIVAVADGDFACDPVQSRYFPRS